MYIYIPYIYLDIWKPFWNSTMQVWVKSGVKKSHSYKAL